MITGAVSRGTLRVHPRAAPGVGETSAALGEAHRRAARQVSIDGVAVRLTPAERARLWELVRPPGRLVGQRAMGYRVTP